MDSLRGTLELVRGTPLRRDLILYKPTLITSEGRPAPFTFCLSPMKCIIFFLYPNYFNWWRGNNLKWQTGRLMLPSTATPAVPQTSTFMLLLTFWALLFCGLLCFGREEDDLQSPFPYSLCLKGVPYF